MGRFRDLAKIHDQRLRFEHLPSMVASTRMSMWNLDEPFSLTGTRVLIGVATWSTYDLDLLDALESGSFGDDTVHLFDADLCASMADFKKYIPGFDKVFHTPVVGYWEDGQLLYRNEGAAARDWIRNRYVLAQS